jgi:hypothetical protein
MRLRWRRGLDPVARLPGLARVHRRQWQLLEGGLAGHMRPGRGGQRCGQAPAPAALQLVGGRFGLVGGQAHQGQQGQRLGRRGHMPRLAREVTRGVLQRLGHALLGGWAQERCGGAGGAQAVVLNRQADLVPDVFMADELGLGQGAGQQRAAVVQVLLRIPGRQRRGPHVLPGLVLGEQGVAGDLAVVVHAKARVLHHQVGPVAAAAQFQQPVVAQPVFDIGAGPARIKGVQLELLGCAQAVLQLPVGHPGRQWMVHRRDSPQRCGQLVPVLLGQCLARGHNPAIGVGRWRGGGRPDQGQRAGQRQETGDPRQVHGLEFNVEDAFTTPSVGMPLRRRPHPPCNGCELPALRATVRQLSFRPQAGPPHHALAIASSVDRILGGMGCGGLRWRRQRRK